MQQRKERKVGSVTRSEEIPQLQKRADRVSRKKTGDKVQRELGKKKGSAARGGYLQKMGEEETR